MLAIDPRLALKSTVDLSDIEVSRRLFLRYNTPDAYRQTRCMLECHKFLCLCKRASNWFEDEHGVLRRALDVLPLVVHLRTVSESSVSDYTYEQSVSAYQNFLTSVSGLELSASEAVLVKICDNQDILCP